MTAAVSPREAFAALSEEEQAEKLDSLSDVDLQALLRDWRWYARPSQIEPDGDWRWWGVVTGRGFGKNRVGSEWVLDRSEQFAVHDSKQMIGLLNTSFDHVKDVQIGGESGLRVCAERRGARVDHAGTNLDGRIRTWVPGSGWHDSIFEIHTAVKPDRIRGRNFHTLWGDEFASWPVIVDSEGGTVFTNGDLGLRALCPPGLRPRGLATSTPKAVQLVRDFVSGEFGDTTLTTGSMYENRANLALSFLLAIERRYEGSRLGAQEIHGRLLDAIEGALWQRSGIEATRLLPGRDGLPDLVRVVVGVDPPGSPSGAECGIVVAGWAWDGGAPALFVLADYSMAGGADEWAARVVQAYREFGADSIVAETNYGGDMVRATISLTDGTVPFEPVRATRGKAVRAEPIATLWSPAQARGHLVGSFPELEDQLCSWVPGDKVSPDRLDAMVWCGHALLPDLTTIEVTRAQSAANVRL